MTESLPILRGTLDVLVLRALVTSPMHGLEISEWLETRAGGNLDVLDSALYQALYRLEARQLVAGDWGTTDNSRRARYYRITRQGRAHLQQETARWVRYAETVTDILTTPA